MRSFGVTAALALGSGASNLTGSIGGRWRRLRAQPIDSLRFASDREADHQQQNHARAAAKHGELAAAKRGDARHCDVEALR